MGRVTQLIPGGDQSVRRVFVHHSIGSIDKYPINSLYLLEVSVTHADSRKTKSTPAPIVPPPQEEAFDSSTLDSLDNFAGRPHRMSAKLVRHLNNKFLS